ncbi:hypothetical protein [Patulibacter sp. SYSU D01012]|uniref:hypothetical protein n=1 Tax=Patulibacter sp. SYSU D01012 TaxID=2817381 RepID=UPI001B3033F3|nr:hypothetical protein [Patulibacter sp. SYSU D01012]
MDLHPDTGSGRHAGGSRATAPAGPTSAVTAPRGVLPMPAVDHLAFRCAVALAAFLAFFAAFAALRHGHAGGAGVLAGGLVLAVGGCAAAFGAGVAYDADGLVVTGLRRRRIPWAAVDGFSVEEEGGVAVCEVRRRDAAPLVLYPLGTAPTADPARSAALHARVRELNGALRRATAAR